ncbi:MAG: hypothetical protein JW724_08080 [Candidatus Altiarchaeota archaeon]|nr:hypothetical protein [Candidatus Altiarchaeota archaeon]
MIDDLISVRDSYWASHRAEDDEDEVIIVVEDDEIIIVEDDEIEIIEDDEIIAVRDEDEEPVLMIEDDPGDEELQVVA